VFLDAVENRYVEELGGMNVMFVMDDGSIITPPLGGTILPGITRDSLLTLARDQGINVREERYSIDQWKADAESGKLREAFACGTAAVLTPIGKVRGRGYEFVIGNGGPGLVTEKLRAELGGIQRGTAEDPHGWVERLI
jgi:branched-chain amino acid aminotransferase